MEILLQVEMFFLNSIGDQKKNVFTKIEGFLSPNSIKDRKKKVFTVIWHYVYAAGIRDLLVLPETFLFHHQDVYF